MEEMLKIIEAAISKFKIQKKLCNQHEGCNTGWMSADIACDGINNDIYDYRIAPNQNTDNYHDRRYYVTEDYINHLASVIAAKLLGKVIQRQDIFDKKWKDYDGDIVVSWCVSYRIKGDN
jgi:hypothetical protein